MAENGVRGEAESGEELMSEGVGNRGQEGVMKRRWEPRARGGSQKRGVGAKSEGWEPKARAGS